MPVIFQIRSGDRIINGGSSGGGNGGGIDTTKWFGSIPYYEGFAFSVRDQDSSPSDLFFKPDGTKVFVVGDATEKIYSYTLATAWDLNTATYDNKFLDVSNKTITPRAMFIRDDGLKLFVIGDFNIYEYDISTAWDISTATFKRSKNIGAEDSTHTGLFFKPDGTGFFTTGQGNDKVYEYSLFQAWSVSFVTFTNKSLDVTPESNDPQGLFFKPDGKRLYVYGGQNKNVFSYTLSTAWDLSTATADNKRTYTDVEDPSGRGVSFKSDGSKFFIITSTKDKIYPFTVPSSWELVNFINTGEFSLSSQDGVMEGIFFKPDGTKLFTVGNNNDTVYSYSLSTAWSINTASYDNKSFSVASQDTSPRGVFVKNDGKKMFICGDANLSIFSYSLATAWDLDTASYDNASFSVASQQTAIRGVFFKDDGTKMFIVGFPKGVYSYTLSTAWDISTASYDNVVASINEVGNPQDIFFRPDGKSFFVCEIGSRFIYSYDLSTAWDLSTATYNHKFTQLFDMSGGNITGINFSSDGTKLFISEIFNDKIIEFTLNT